MLLNAHQKKYISHLQSKDSSVLLKLFCIVYNQKEAERIMQACIMCPQYDIISDGVNVLSLSLGAFKSLTVGLNCCSKFYFCYLYLCLLPTLTFLHVYTSSYQNNVIHNDEYQQWSFFSMFIKSLMLPKSDFIIQYYVNYFY